MATRCVASKLGAPLSLLPAAHPCRSPPPSPERPSLPLTHSLCQLIVFQRKVLLGPNLPVHWSWWLGTCGVRGGWCDQLAQFLHMLGRTKRGKVSCWPVDMGLLWDEAILCRGGLSQGHGHEGGSSRGYRGGKSSRGGWSDGGSHPARAAMAGGAAGRCPAGKPVDGGQRLFGMGRWVGEHAGCWVQGSMQVRWVGHGRLGSTQACRVGHGRLGNTQGALGGARQVGEHAG